MSVRSGLIAVWLGFGLFANPAIAADLAAVRAPAQATFGHCPPFGMPNVYYQRDTWIPSMGPRLVYLNPPPNPYPIYVAPRQAFLVSDPCPNEYRRNWYEGKVFYYNAGTPLRPDTFVIDQRY